MNRPAAVRAEVGDWGVAVMPCSEVCMHMRVADLKMIFQIVSERMVQLYIIRDNDTLARFSAPITLGEAGVYQDSAGLYFYGESLNYVLKGVTL